MIDPRWLTTNVTDLISAIIAERKPHLLPILADALMDAGCDDEQLTDYLRQQTADWMELYDCWTAFWTVKYKATPDPDDVLRWMEHFAKVEYGLASIRTANRRLDQKQG